MGKHILKICPHCGMELEPTIPIKDYDMQIVECSPKAKQYVKEVEDIAAGVIESKKKYPFDALMVGYSFCYPLGKRASLCTLSSIENKKGSKQFKVIAHKELGLCEVVRLK